MAPFAFQASLLRPGRRDRLRDGGRLGTCFPGPGRARRNPLLSQGKVSLLSFSSDCQAPEVAASRPPPAPRFHSPSHSPSSGSCSSLESAPETSRRRGCFSASRFLRSRRALYPSRCRSAARGGRGPGSPFKFDPARVLAGLLRLAGATRWAPSAVLGSELHSPKPRWDPLCPRGSPPCAPLPSPQSERRV